MVMVKIFFTWLMVMIFYAVYKLIFKKERPIPEQVIIKAKNGKRTIVILRNK